MVAVPSPGWWRSSDRAGGLRVRVLIAEDDPVSRTILRHVVEKFGHECLVAEDGVRAWELYRSTPSVNVVISDWMMPGMDGLELCRMVRRENRDEYTYFMFLTALGDREHLLTGLEAGADDYLAKPLDRAELQMRLVAASRVTSLHRQLTEQKAELVQRSRQAALGEYVSVALIESGSLPVILRRCAEAIVQHLDAACVRIWTFNDEDGILELQAGAGVSCFPDGPLDRVAVGESDIGLVARERRPRWTNDLLNAPWMSGKDWARRIGVVAFAGHPLTVEGRLVGVLGAFAREPLGEDAFKTLASVADTMAQGIERKRVERQLRHQLDFTRAITDSLSSGLLALDAKGRVTFMNPAAERMLGSTESESLGKGIREVVSPAHTDAFPTRGAPVAEEHAHGVDPQGGRRLVRAQGRDGLPSGLHGLADLRRRTGGGLGDGFPGHDQAQGGGRDEAAVRLDRLARVANTADLHQGIPGSAHRRRSGTAQRRAARVRRDLLPQRQAAGDARR